MFADDYNTRTRFAAALAAERIVDTLANGDNFGSEVRLMRDLAVTVLAAIMDADDTPAANLVDEAVRFEIDAARWSSESLIDRYYRFVGVSL